MTDIAAFIRTKFKLDPVPVVPEVRIYGAHAGSGLGRLLGPHGAPPYWAYPWGGGIVLARYILDHPAIVAGRTVLDLGTGSGLVAIAAKRAGARHVMACDVDPLAVTAAAVNAAENGVEISTQEDDILAGETPEAEVLLVGDLFYDAALAERVTAFLTRCVVAGRTVLVGDPGRSHLPHSALRRLADYDVPDFGDAPVGVRASSAIYAFEGSRAEGSPSRAA